MFRNRAMPEEKKEKGFKTQGGMLSGADIRRRVICEEEIDDYLKLFVSVNGQELHKKNGNR